jgi:hypothetical protein
VPQDLDPVEIARREDRWSWSVSLPMQVEKLWADLQSVRKQVQVARDKGAQPADACACARLYHLWVTLNRSSMHGHFFQS